MPPVIQSSRSLASYRVLNLRRQSLLRGNLLVLVSFIAAFRMADFPRNRANLLLVLPAILAALGTFDTIRCMQPKWNFYHGGVVLCIYMDLMAVCLILFFLMCPYLL